MWKKFINDKSGNFSIMMAGSVLMLLGALGLSVDYMAMTDISDRLQAATDRAALIAAQSTHLSQEESIIAANESFADFDLESATSEIVSSYEFNNDTILVSAQLNYRPLLLGILGHGEQTVSVSSTTPNVEFGGVDVSLVLDVTGSMKGSKLVDLKNSVNGFLDEFAEFNTDVRVAVVPFSQYVNAKADGNTPVWIDNDLEGTDFSSITDPVPIIDPTTGTEVPTITKLWDGCVGSRLAPFNVLPEYGGSRFPAVYDDGINSGPAGDLTRYYCPEPLLPLTDKFSTVRAKVNGLTAAGRTSIPPGLMCGWRTLDSRLPLVNVTTGKARRKILVLMTDGGNTIIQTPGEAYHWDNKKVLGNDVKDRADDRTRDICDTINLTTDITIYSIAFDINSPEVIDLVKGCATQPEFFFNADDDGSSLEQAFLSISEGLTKIRLLN